MPFKSESQRKLFWAARKDPKVRKRMRLKLKDVKKMTSHDTGGRLPANMKAVR